MAILTLILTLLPMLFELLKRFIDKDDPRLKRNFDKLAEVRYEMDRIEDQMTRLSIPSSKPKVAVATSSVPGDEVYLTVCLSLDEEGVH